MSKEKSFQRAEIRDLTGGLNLKDFETEIDNKQCLKSENWIAEGAKLVSGKGYDNIINKGMGLIQGLTTNLDDVYYVSEGNIYKNGDTLFLGNEYDITFSNVDGNPFSISIDGVSKVYKFGFYGNEALALADLETALTTDFPTYTITRVGSVFTISKAGVVISIINPNLIKKIEISNWNIHTKLDIVIDGITYSKTGVDYPNVSDFLDWIITQLGATYKTKRVGDVLYIGKEHTTVTTSYTEYDRYTAEISYKYGDLSGVEWDYTNSIIDGITYTTPGTQTLVFRGDKIIRNLGGYVMTENYTYDTSDGGWTTQTGRNITTYVDGILTTVQKGSLCTATRCILKQGATTIATVNFVGDIATFNEEIDKNLTYSILVDNNGATYINHYDPSPTAAQTNDYFTLETAAIVFAITEVNVQFRNPVGYDLSTRFYKDVSFDTEWTEGNEINYFNLFHYLYINRTDYNEITFSSTNYYTDNTNNGVFTNFTTFNNKATASITNSTIASYLSVNTGLGILSDDLYNINVNNYGILLISKRGFNPIFIDTTGTSFELATSVVGSPTVGIVYKGKTVLGGYKNDGLWNDNILFSKTAIPGSEANLKDFSAYSAGGQSVSGGNGGRITGMIVNEEGLLVFKNNEIWKTNSENDTGTVFNFIFKKITNTGALNQNVITPVQQDIFYYDHITRCVRRLSYEENMQTLRDTNISKDVESYFKAIPDDDEGNDERYSDLINSNFSYPYYTINITSNTSPYLYISGNNEDYKYRVPNIQLIYNVENSAWTTRTDFIDEDRYPIMSYNGIVGTTGIYIYKDFIGNTDETGIFESKKYTLSIDSRHKRIGEFDIVGKIIPEDGQTKSLLVEVLLNDIVVQSLIISSLTDILSFKKRIDLYHDGEELSFRLTHSGAGKVEVNDVYVLWRELKLFFN